MKKTTFKAALDELMEKNLNIKIICTDRHVSIRNLIREQYTKIKHQFDVWYLAKDVVKEILEVSHQKSCKELAEWVNPIKKSFMVVRSHVQREQTNSA